MKRTMLAPGIGATLTAMGYRSSGNETMPRWAANATTIILTSGAVRFAYFTAQRTESVTQASITVGGTAAGATPTLIRYGLYSVAANGDLTQIAATTSDTTLLAVTGTVYNKAFASSASLTAGSRYAFCALVVTGATAPSVTGIVGPSGADMGNDPKLAGVFTSQTDLLSSYTAAQITSSSNVLYASIR